MDPNDPGGHTDPTAPLVRPIGYVEDEPISRRIGERNVSVGTARAADPTLHDEEFTYVLSTTADEQPLTTHHRPLIDGPDTDWQSFERAIDTARTLYRTGEPTLVHCKAGISRSSAVVATTLAAEEDRSFHEALAIVQEERPHAIPHPALHELAVVYLASRS